MNKKLIQTMAISLLIPCIACVLQWIFWDEFQPFIWFLFYPSVFFSAQIGGRKGGIAATLLSVFLVIFFFVEPVFSLQISRINTLYSVTVFILMGFLFSSLQENFKKGQQKLQESEISLRALNAEQKRNAEEDLNKAMERLNLATSAAQIGIWDWDIQKDKLVWDERMYALYGIKSGAFGGAYEAWLQGVHPEDREHSNEASNAAVRGERDYETEFRVVWPDGAVHWLKASGQVFRDENGEAVRMVGVNYDITEHKNGEAELRERERKLSAIFDLLPVGISILDGDQKIVYQNQSLGNILLLPREGLQKGEYHRRRYLQGDGSAMPAEKFASAQALKEQRTIQGIVTGVVKEDGETIWASVSAVPVDFSDWKLVIVTVDITERKRAEEKLRESEEFLRLAYEAVNLGIWKNDLQTGSVEFDERARIHYGFDTLHTTISEVTNRVHPDDLARLGAEIAAATAPTGKGTFATEYRVIHPDGSVHWLAIGVRVTFEGEGEGRHALMGFGTTLDITERKNAERELINARDFMDKLFHLDPVAKTLARISDHVIVDINQATEQLFGTPREECIGNSTGTLDYWADPAEQQRGYALFAEQGGYLRDFVFQYKHTSGKTGWASIYAEIIEIQDEKYVMTEFIDITGRKRAEENLRQRTEELEQLLDILPEAIWIADDPECKVIHGNRFANNLLGVTEKDNISQSATSPAVVLRQFSQGRELGPDELPMQMAGLTGQPQLDFELQIDRPNDVTHILLGGAVPLFDPAGRTRGVVAAFHDITERKLAEDELRRSNAELEQFAYVASHDLQEPLRAVAGMVQLLGQRFKGKLDERADEYIGHAVEASLRMQSLINDLLDYSRVGRFGKSFVPTALESSVKIALANLDAVIRENQAQVTIDPLPTVAVDPGQLTQVFQNLIGNALKFRGESLPRIQISAEKVGEDWRISVSDNGIGIETQFFERIFLVFQRLHTRREYPGTGIGLSLCKKIIERHGGQIWVESQPGQGSTFYFTLPEKRI